MLSVDDDENPPAKPQGTITSTERPMVAGFRWAGMSSGIKKDGGPDLALLAADRPVATAAMFTTNRVKAAPVVIAQERIEQGRIQAVVVNSGNANACTGRDGLQAARSVTTAVAAALGTYDAVILPCSTGVIGEPLPSERIEAAVPRLVHSLSPEGIDAFSQAILTTDKGPKIAWTQFSIGLPQPVSILGVGKGAGMCHPNMATVLAFLVTDAPMHSTTLQRALRQATERTWNQMTVDGDTSTNDTVVAMASGALQAEPLSATGSDGRRFTDGLADVLGKLGKMIVSDGEGAEHTVTIDVGGAPSEDAARNIARTIATSLLVKTAIHGKDPNWGRILAAAGRAGVAFDPNKVEIRFGEAVVAKNGVGLGPGAEAHAREVMRQPEYAIRIRFGPGNSQAEYLTCDIGGDYVRINANYRS